jgi:DNA-directed RNA polymerase specialized sigma24 family protein
MFPETSRSLLALATLHGEAEGREAMESLCERYYQPIKSFILWNERHASDADDLTQAFFLHICEKGVMRRAERDRGKFRTFMISVLKNFLSHTNRAAATQKRGGRVELLTLDEVDAPTETDDARFDRAWAMALMDAALTQVAAEITETRGVEALKTLRLFLSAQHTAPSYETAAQSLNLSVAALKVDVMRWRRPLRELVRAEIGRTVSAPHEAEEEFVYLRQLLMA